MQQFQRIADYLVHEFGVDIRPAHENGSIRMFTDEVTERATKRHIKLFVGDMVYQKSVDAALGELAQVSGSAANRPIGKVDANISPDGLKIRDPRRRVWTKARAEYAPSVLWFHTNDAIHGIRNEVFEHFLGHSEVYRRFGAQGVAKKLGLYFNADTIGGNIATFVDKKQGDQQDFPTAFHERKCGRLLFGHLPDFRKEGMDTFVSDYKVAGDSLVIGINRLAHEESKVYQKRLGEIHKIKKVYGRSNEELYPAIIADEIKR